MPKKCCIPGCKTNYDSSKEEQPHYVAVFKFPNDPVRKELWLNAIPRKNFTPTINSCVCAKHFLAKFIIGGLIIHKRNGTVEKKRAYRATLTKDAYPSIFPDPDSIPKKHRRKRKKKILGANWMSTDKIPNFKLFCHEAKDYLGDRWVSEFDVSGKKQKLDCIRFHLKQETTESYDPGTLFTVTVFSNMRVKVHSYLSGDISDNFLAGIVGVRRSSPILVYWSQFVTIISQCSTGFMITDLHSSLDDMHGLSDGEEKNQIGYSSIGGATVCKEEPPSYPTEGFGLVGENDDVVKILRNENVQLTQKLYDAIFHRNQLLRKLKDIQELARIDLDALDSVLVPKGRKEMKKVYKLVEAIMKDAEKITAGQSCFPVLAKETSMLVQDDDLCQPNLPTYQVISTPTGDTMRLEVNAIGETTTAYGQSDIYSNIKAQPQNDEKKEEEEEEDGDSDNKNAVIEVWEPESIACEVCGKTFPSEKSVYLHQRYVHKGMHSTKCPVCGKECRTTSYVKVHMSKHSDERPHQCSICGKTFKCKTSILRHNRFVHSEAKPHKCSICGKAFKHSINMKKHERAHSEKRKRRNQTIDADRSEDGLFHCKVCGQGFKLVSRLHYHMSHHSEEKTFLCSVCGKAYRFRDALCKHKKSHAQEAPYACSLCPKRFKFKSVLKTHQSVHAEIGDFKCDICDKRFKSRRSVQKHQVTHSQEQNYNNSSYSQAFDQEDLTVGKEIHANREQIMTDRISGLDTRAFSVPEEVHFKREFAMSDGRPRLEARDLVAHDQVQARREFAISDRMSGLGTSTRDQTAIEQNHTRREFTMSDRLPGLDTRDQTAHEQILVRRDFAISDRLAGINARDLASHEQVLARKEFVMSDTIDQTVHDQSHTREEFVIPGRIPGLNARDMTTPHDQVHARKEFPMSNRMPGLNEDLVVHDHQVHARRELAMTERMHQLERMNVYPTNEQQNESGFASSSWKC